MKNKNIENTACTFELVASGKYDSIYGTVLPILAAEARNIYHTRLQTIAILPLFLATHDSYLFC